MTTKQSDSADEAYAKLLESWYGERRRKRAVLARIRMARPAVSCAVAATLLAAYLFPSALVYLAGVAVTLVVSLLLINALELRCIHAAAIADAGVLINRYGIARRRREWTDLPERPVDRSMQESPSAIDLDLFGHASLMQLLCTAESQRGIAKLAAWISDPAEVAEIVRRQRVASVLAPLLSWRQALQQKCLVIAERNQQTENLIAWGSSSSNLPLPKPVRGYVWSLRLLVPLMLGVVLFRPDVATVMFAVVLFLNFAMTVAYSGQIHSFFRSILSLPRRQSHRTLSDAFTHVHSSAAVREALPQECVECETAVRELQRLERILGLESIASNPLTMLFVYIPLQFLVLWDLQIYMAACDWQQRSGASLASWFEILGEVEAHCSLASLSFEQPTWGFADVSEANEEKLVLEQMGHPLLPDESRVANDVSVGPAGSLLLITGSNMGGKSTLLRAIGLNLVLAQAGAASCAKAMVTPRVTVMTSMRVSDSLSDSTSLFMAQLLQMKRIVDHLKANDDGKRGTLVLYLFDEILNGTNTTDRRRAVEELVGYLLRSRAIGAMTTHDLEIATQSRYKDRFQSYYLAHQLDPSEETPELKFDYKLREGVSPSSNAMLLVRLLGIPRAN